MEGLSTREAMYVIILYLKFMVVVSINCI